MTRFAGPVSTIVLATTVFGTAPIAHAASDAIDCATIRESDLIETGESPDIAFVDTTDGCRIENLVYGPATDMVRWQVDRLDVEGRWDRAANEGGGHVDEPPTSLTLSASGIRQVIDVEDPRTAYQFRVNQRPLTAKLDYDRDAVTGAFDLHEFSVEGDWLGRFDLALEAQLPARIDLERWRDTNARIESLGARLDNEAIVESVVVPMLSAVLPLDADPAEVFPRYQARLVAALRDLPDTVASEPARDALAAFVTDFPHPTGSLEARMRFERPIGLMQALSCRVSPYCLESLAASYTPDGDE